MVSAPKRSIFPVVVVLFLVGFLTLALVANKQKRRLFSEAQFSTLKPAPTNTPTPVPICRDGTPADSCCKSGFRCVEADGVYLCIGSSCAGTSQTTE